MIVAAQAPESMTKSRQVLSFRRLRTENNLTHNSLSDTNPQRETEAQELRPVTRGKRDRTLGTTTTTTTTTWKEDQLKALIAKTPIDTRLIMNVTNIEGGPRKMEAIVTATTRNSITVQEVNAQRTNDDDNDEVDTYTFPDDGDITDVSIIEELAGIPTFHSSTRPLRDRPRWLI